MGNRTKVISYIIGLLIALQFLLFGIKQVIFIFIERTNITDRVASLTAMLILSATLYLLSKKQNVPLSVLPEKFHKLYIATTVIAAVIFITTPSNYTGGWEAVVLLFYGSVVTPLFEELLFRGYIWNKLSIVYKNEYMVYIISVLLFALWHIGYIDAIAFRTDTGLINVMFWKVAVGFFYGTALGALRLKTKNSYSTMLLHGVMNIFGR